jgi:hypothetical protein
MSTSQAPAGYDPAAAGCWSNGTPIAWTAGRIPYAVAARASREVDLAAATHAVHLAFDAWNRAPCEGGTPNVTLYDDGPIDLKAPAGCGSNECNAAAASHSIVFDDDAWPYEGSTNTLALTTVSFDVRAAEIFDAYIEVNSHDHVMSAREPPPPGMYGLQAIMTHEAGHFIGLAHATAESSVMYAFYRPGRTRLTPDDVSAVCETYPPVPTSGLACGSGRVSSGGRGVAACALLALAVGAARRRSRGSSRLAGRADCDKRWGP